MQGQYASRPRVTFISLHAVIVSPPEASSRERAPPLEGVNLGYLGEDVPVLRVFPDEMSQCWMKVPLVALSDEVKGVEDEDVDAGEVDDLEEELLVLQPLHQVGT